MAFMMRSNTPGVYLREVEPLSPVPLRLSVTGFAGQSERGPLNHPQPLTGWSQFQDIFGGFVGFSYLPYAVFGFFLNGGERCYVVRVGHETARRACLDLVSEKNEPVIRVEAINEGEWAGEVSVVCDEKSTFDMTLTELDGDASKSTVIDKDTAKLKSVAGLDALDEVSIVNRLDPFLREEGLEIIGIDFNAKTVKFDREIARPFPAGSSVLGKGFRLGFEYRVNGRTLREEVFDNLSMEESHERYFASVINGDPEEKDYSKKLENGNSILVRVADLVKGRPGSISRPKTITAQGLKGGQDGPRNLDARYYTGYDQEAYFRPRPPDADETELKEIEEKLFGLAAFEAVGEIGLIAIPDLILPDMYAQVPESKIPEAGIIFAGTGLDMLRLENLKAGQRDMLRHCEKSGDRFAILDSPRGAETRKGAGRIEDWPKDLRPFPNSKNGALYYPWIKEKVSDFDGRDLFIPPSGHIAGIYAATERERGVGKAPANEVLQGVVDLEFCLSDAEQDILNPLGVNCLRIFPGRGLRVWGARTLSRDPLWRYVNVRRVYLAIVKQIMVNLQWTVFEPNDRRLWDKIASTLTLFFRDLFQSGALAGARPEEAFFVKCDEETNPPDVIDRGEVITQIGFAPARPAEFILVTIRRTAESLSVSERAT